MTPKELGLEELLTIPEVARRLRVDPATVGRWVRNGALEVVRLPHSKNRQSYRVKQSTMDALVGEK